MLVLASLYDSTIANLLLSDIAIEDEFDFDCFDLSCSEELCFEAVFPFISCFDLLFCVDLLLNKLIFILHHLFCVSKLGISENTGRSYICWRSSSGLTVVSISSSKMEIKHDAARPTASPINRFLKLSGP